MRETKSSWQPMTNPTKHFRPGLVVNAFPAALGFTLLGLVLWRNSEKIGEVFRHWLDLRLLGLGLLIYQVSLFITFSRWYMLVRVVEPCLKLRASIVLGFIGNLFSLVIPGPAGGDFIKAAYLLRMHIKQTQAVASMLIDRIIGLLGLFVLAAGAGGLAWGVATPDVRKLIVAAWVALGLGVLLLAGIFTQVLTRSFPGLGGEGHGRLTLIMSELKAVSTTYRSRLDVVLAGLGLSVFGHALNVLAFFLVGKMLFPAGMTTTLAQHYLMVPLILFSTVVPLPFGALGLSEGVSDQLLRMVGHPGGALAMMGFRVLAYGCGLSAACVYLTNQGEVRALSASAPHRIDQKRVGESDGGEDQDLSQHVETSRSRRNAGEGLAVGR